MAFRFLNPLNVECDVYSSALKQADSKCLLKLTLKGKFKGNIEVEEVRAGAAVSGPALADLLLSTHARAHTRAQRHKISKTLDPARHTHLHLQIQTTLDPALV